jgi:DNA primase large subunit
MDAEKKFQICPKCRKLMEKHSIKKTLCSCGSDKAHREFDLSSILNVDTILISSRHLYRMPYSLHEKTGLVSVPFDIKHILKFEKSEAEQKIFKPYKFLEREDAKPEEATVLFQKAFDYKSEKQQKNRQETRREFEKSRNAVTSQNLHIDNTAIPEEFFPPCIKKITAGIEDGKKRALFILINFLGACNWEHEKIEEYIMKWNEKNKPDHLRETYIKGQLRYHKQQSQNSKEKIMPPNCDNRGYMIDTRFCNPDNLCRTIKNPAQYAKKKAWLQNNARPKARMKKEK